jgi:2-phospho-L-lactate/phosphoenolpyruvate guanylyltransferase
LTSAALLVPVKDFRAAKQRLAARLAPADRAELARRMANRVLAAAAPLSAFVVCDDPDVAEWADGEDATVLWAPGLGLNGAVRSGIDELGELGFDRVVVCHSDLPLATDLSRFAGQSDHVVIVPDRHGRGTNVLSLPTALPFTLAYGRGSFRLHTQEARRRRMTLDVHRDDQLGWDVDTPADLDHPDLKEFIAWLPTNPANRK